ATASITCHRARTGNVPARACSSRSEPPGAKRTIIVARSDASAGACVMARPASSSAAKNLLMSPPYESGGEEGSSRDATADRHARHAWEEGEKVAERADPAAWGSRRVLGASPRRGRSPQLPRRGCCFVWETAYPGCLTAKPSSGRFTHRRR